MRPTISRAAGRRRKWEMGSLHTHTYIYLSISLYFVIVFFEHLAVWIERVLKAVDYPFRINNKTVFKVTFM